MQVSTFRPGTERSHIFAGQETDVGMKAMPYVVVFVVVVKRIYY